MYFGYGYKHSALRNGGGSSRPAEPAGQVARASE